MSRYLIAFLFLSLIGCGSANDFTDAPRWPYCRCKEYDPEVNPYAFYLHTKLVDSNTGEHCFRVELLGNDNDNSCVSMLEDSVDKFQVAIQPACPPAFDVAGRYVTVNGTKHRSFRVTDYPLHSIIRLNKLGLNRSIIESDVFDICFRAAVPCHIPENFFDVLPPLYTIMESSGHVCCPTRHEMSAYDEL